MMTAISKATIIIPLVVLMVGTGFAFKNKMVPKQNSSVESSPIKASSHSIKIDLKGPLVCDYSSASVAISASIKDKKILIKKTDKNLVYNYLVNGDCLYSWSNNVSGQKTCGLGQYMSTFETLSNMGLMDFNNVLGGLSQFEATKNLVSQKADIEGLVKTCRKEEISDSIFDIPVKISFKK